MLFDPEDGKTSEEIIEIVLRRSPGLRPDLEKMAKVRGLSMDEFVPALVNEARAAHDEQMQDPARRAAYHAKMDWREAPYGQDPLLKKEA